MHQIGAFLSARLGGEGTWIEPGFRCEYGRNITIGERAYLNFGATILDCAPAGIGDDALVGPNLGIYAVSHSPVADQRCIFTPLPASRQSATIRLLM